MCVLQDFEAITPNLLARTIETVEGGGLVVIMLKTMKSLRQLYAMTMVSPSIGLRRLSTHLFVGRACTLPDVVTRLGGRSLQRAVYPLSGLL